MSARQGTKTVRCSFRTPALLVLAAACAGLLALLTGTHGGASAAPLTPLAAMTGIEASTEQTGPLLAGARKRMKRGRFHRQQRRRATQRARARQQLERRRRQRAHEQTRVHGPRQTGKADKVTAAQAPLPVRNPNSARPGDLAVPDRPNNTGTALSGGAIETGKPELTATPATPDTIATHNQPGSIIGDDRPHGNPDHGTPDDGAHQDRPRDHGDHGRPHHENPKDRPNANRPGRTVVCLGGRMRKGRCGCGAERTLRRARRAVFVCAPAGVAQAIPGIFQSHDDATAPDSNTINNEPPEPDNQSPPAAAAAALPSFVPDEVLVLLEPEAPDALEELIAQTHGLELVARWPLELIGTRLALFRIPDGRAVAAVVGSLQADGRISGPQPNYYYRVQAEPGPAARPGDALDLQYALAKLDIGRAHELTMGDGVLVAIIDARIDGTHPDLAGALQEQFDAAMQPPRGSTDHGTAIAGIISARGVLKGVAPNARLLGVNALVPAGAGAAATTATLLRGLNWAAGKEADIVNLSLTGPHDALVERGVEAAADQGAIIVAAAGNDGPAAAPAYPAAYPDVIAVTATDVNDRLYSAANHGRYIEIAAPGVDILTPSLEHAHMLQTGTSFAAAHISGIIALMLERNPELDLEEIRAALRGTAIDLGPSGDDAQFGAGGANALAAVEHLVPAAVVKRLSAQ